MDDAWKADANKWFHAALGRYLCDRYQDDGQTDKSIRRLIDTRREAFLYAMGEDHYVKSPIEAALFANLLFAIDGYHDIIWDSAPGSQSQESATTIFRTQERIGRYTVDFLFIAKAGDYERSLIVECDGHAFHEKTKQQAQHDKSRDRALSEVGKVLRFTGSEIYRDPVKCVEEIERHLTNLLEDAMADAGLIKRRKTA